MSVQKHKSVISSAFLLFSLIFSGCLNNTNELTNLKSFYFPVDELKNGLVYEYQSLVDESYEYWFYKKFVSGDSLLMVCQNYDKYLQVRQFQKELISDKGVKLIDLSLFDANASGSITTKVNVISSDLFSFTKRNPDEKLIYHIKWEDRTHNMGVEVIKNRYQDEIYQMDFEGKRINYLKINVSELVSTSQDGHLDLEWYGEEWYAENIGLVFYSKETKTGDRFAYKLVKRTPIDTFLEQQDFEQ